MTADHRRPRQEPALWKEWVAILTGISTGITGGLEFWSRNQTFVGIVLSLVAFVAFCAASFMYT